MKDLLNLQKIRVLFIFPVTLVLSGFKTLPAVCTVAIIKGWIGKEL